MGLEDGVIASEHRIAELDVRAVDLRIISRLSVLVVGLQLLDCGRRDVPGLILLPVSL